MDAVVAVCKLAVEYRQTFNEDCVIDIVCYRRYGHNSLDDPMITQPLMYKMIKDHPPVLTQYTDKLVKSGVISREFVETLSESTMRAYEADFQRSKAYVPDPFEWLSSNWQGMAISDMTQRPYNQTGVKMEVLQKVIDILEISFLFNCCCNCAICGAQVGEMLCQVPKDFTVHADITRLLKQRLRAMETGTNITMPLAESLAFGSLTLASVNLINHAVLIIVLIYQFPFPQLFSGC